MSCLFLLQGFFQIQGLNPHLQYCRRILYRLNQQGSPITGTWYFIMVQLRLFMIIFGFISIVLTHALISRGSNNGQLVTCGRNEVTQFGKKYRMSRKAAQMKPRTTACGNMATASAQWREHTLRSVPGSLSAH